MQLTEHDPIRALALLWRACEDIEGAALHSTDGLQIAEQLRRLRLGVVVKKAAKPHQRVFPDEGGGEQLITYFLPSAQGRWLWQYVKGVMTSVLERGEDEIPGWRVPFI